MKKDEKSVDISCARWYISKALVRQAPNSKPSGKENLKNLKFPLDKGSELCYNNQAVAPKGERRRSVP